MKIDLLNIDTLIDVNKLEEVKSTRLFSNKMTFDPEGLLSNEIFGLSKGDRRNTFAYIDLKIPFIHPHIYSNVLKSMQKNIIYAVSGQRKFTIRNGQLIEDPDNGWTGIQNLYKHWDEIDWSKSKSTNTTNKSLMTNLTRKDVFINKITVVPPAYRDVMIAGTVDSSDHVNELNDLYLKLLRSCALLSEGGIFAYRQYSTQYKIQETLVEIFNYFKKQISRKHGLIRKNLLGKSIDYGARVVISANNYNNYTMNDSMIDLDHSAVPISHCCSLFYPFIEAWVTNFFTREIINDPNSIIFYDHESKKEISGQIVDAEVQFSEKNIKKMINDYILNPDNRFKLINVNVDANGKLMKASIILKGKIILENNITKVLNRAMTITDLLYIACVDVCEKRHIMVSRYPVGTDKGIYFNKIRVSSTRNHVKLIFNGKEYPFYPDIDFSVPQEKVGVQFIDTLVMSNAHLDGMGADFDGDQVSERGIYSDEANAEAEQIMNTKMAVLTITGSNSKCVAKEVFNSLYELTKIGKEPGKLLSDADHMKYLNMPPDAFTLPVLVDMFADTVDNTVKNNNGKRKSRYKTWDKFNIPAGYFYKGQPAIETTIGRFVANKFILEGCGAISSTHFVDSVLNKSNVTKLDEKIGQLYAEDVIERRVFNNYVDRRDTIGFWLNGMLAHTISERMLKPLPEVEKRKAELIEQYKDELAAGNVDVMTKISNELIAYAKEILKDDPGMDLYDSGDLDFSNNYRNNSIIKGAVINKITNEFDFIGTSLMDGIEIKDIPAHANGILASQYPASIATAGAGYLGKQLLALLQMMVTDDPDTDCGTKRLIPLKITKLNADLVTYTWIDDGSGQLSMITKENVGKYVGKTVKMRSPMSCRTEKICAKCAGKLFYLLNVTYAGLFGIQISHADLNLALKAKHNSVVNLFTLDPDSIIEDIDEDV